MLLVNLLQYREVDINLQSSFVVHTISVLETPSPTLVDDETLIL